MKAGKGYMQSLIVIVLSVQKQNANRNEERKVGAIDV